MRNVAFSRTLMPASQQKRIPHSDFSEVEIIVEKREEFDASWAVSLPDGPDFD
jgi:hypothetical protein